jgi:hypothetical protein
VIGISFSELYDIRKKEIMLEPNNPIATFWVTEPLVYQKQQGQHIQQLQEQLLQQ